ncbi:thiamine pyrophosphate-dependent dehydrogenase E1 component subunit alpha [Magnetovibrio sp.]|uniref:thiamine pyrophosphate-dependent dehydrogenase E1 component subunit alpha n=1 Tax=Magnetovibrio sp. TaxID=2024836 RepID=UPI002F94AD75
MNNELRKDLFRSLLRVRAIENRIIDKYGENEMRCPTHFSIGQEAAAVGVCAHLRPEDYTISAHRSHAHYLCKGGSLPKMMAELYGKETGCAGGKGGSMHLVDFSVNFIGCVPIVGSTIPIGVGASFGRYIQDESALTAVFFGDGATETGVFHESLNFASVHKLPVVFVCENNLYSVNTPLEMRQPQERTIAQLAETHGLKAVAEDGQEVEKVYAVAGELIDHVRSGQGPVLLELATYRWLEHCGPRQDLHLDYRPEGEFDHWVSRCPVKLYQEKMLNEGHITKEEIDAMQAEIDAEIDTAFDFAKNSPFPDRSQLMANIYAS